MEINPFAGYNFFENEQNLKNRPIYGGRLGYNFTENFALEGTVEFINTHVDNKAKTGIKEGQYRSPTDSVNLFFYHIDALYHFMPERKFNPFVVAGIGGSHSSAEISDKDMTMYDFGVGAKYWVAENVALRVDIRDNLVTESFQESYHNLNATAGIVVAFGGGAKPAQECPSCPAPAALKEKDTTAPYVTLAIPYNASTGSPRHAKTRVAFSEAMDPATIGTKTFFLSKGETPVQGTVLAPTGTSASFTQTSVLDPDTLYTGTVTTGAKDLAGNPLANDYVWTFKTEAAPDQQPAAKVVTINRFVMLEDTHFKFDQASLTPQGQEMLNKNIQIMQDNPGLKVRIAGYTSASGTPAYNQALSEPRADTVMTYIINGGIAPERLDTIGYGEARPAVYEPLPEEIRSKEAKANMRVLFEVIVK